MNYFRTLVRSIVPLAALGFAQLAVTPFVHAQESKLLKVNVPFAFQNGAQHLPAGTYTLRLNNHVLQILGAQTAGVALMRDEDGAPASRSCVIFLRYGDQHFLHEVWMAGSKTPVRTSKSREEKRAEQAAQLAVRGVGANGVEVAVADLPR